MGSFDPTFGPTSSYPLSEANLPHPMIDQVDHWRKPKLWFESFEFDVYTQQTENEIKSEDKESTFFNHNSAIRQHTITNWRFNFAKWWSSLMIDLAHCRHAVRPMCIGRPNGFGMNAVCSGAICSGNDCSSSDCIDSKWLWSDAESQWLDSIGRLYCSFSPTRIGSVGSLMSLPLRPIEVHWDSLRFIEIHWGLFGFAPKLSVGLQCGSAWKVQKKTLHRRLQDPK